MADYIHKRITEARLCYMLYTQRNSLSDDKDVTNQGHLTENPVNKLKTLYDNTLN